MMLISFTSIYLITYKNIHTDINMELNKISDGRQKLNDGDPKTNFNSPKQSPDFQNGQPPTERSTSFNITTDSDWNIISTFSAFDIDDSFYETAKLSALSENTNKGDFYIDGSYIAFIITPHHEGYYLSFLDISSQKAILKNLIFTFLTVAFFMVIFIFFISKFFANKSIKPIKEAFDKQKQFIADASHELKTPLTVINTNVDVLLSNSDDIIQNQSKWLHYIKSETERMNKLTSDLLYLAQVDHSDIKLIFSQFNLSEAVEHVILTMEGVIFENNIALSYNIEPNLMMNGNNEQVKQVIMILLDNAVKYTDSNGRITLSLGKNYNKTSLSVTNTGRGIPQEDIEKIFDRFYRTDKSRSRDSGGYGLGLAIAKAIVNQNGGKISVKSTINEETTFTVDFPRINS